MKEHKLLRVFWEILLGAFLLMPLIVTLIYSFVKRWTGVLPEGLTLQYYLAAVTNQSFLLGIFRGLVISALPVLLTNISILLALYVALVYLPSMEKWIQIFCLLPTTINGIIVATSVLSLYAGSGTILANRIVMLTLIYCVFVMPVTYQGIRNSLYAVNRNSGSSPDAGLWKILQFYGDRGTIHFTGSLRFSPDESCRIIWRFRDY